MKVGFDFIARIKSFKYAFRGISLLLSSQHNAWIHASATVIVITTGLFFHISSRDWGWLVMAMTLVWTAESFNTAIEFLADGIMPDFHPAVAKAKDIAAGGVLMTAIGAALIGCVIFYPYFRIFLLLLPP